MNRGEKRFTFKIATTLWGVGEDAWLQNRFGYTIDLLGKQASMSGERVYRPLMDFGMAFFLTGGGKENL